MSAFPKSPPPLRRINQKKREERREDLRFRSKKVGEEGGKRPFIILRSISRVPSKERERGEKREARASR